MVLYGERGLHAFEVNRAAAVRREDFDGLALFREQFPVAACHLVYGGSRRYTERDVDVVPFGRLLAELHRLL